MAQPIFLIVSITVLAGEIPYPLKRTASNESGDIESALNTLNEELKAEFLSDPDQCEVANNDESLAEWQKGFWHEGVHTLQITSYSEINSDQFNTLKNIGL